MKKLKYLIVIIVICILVFIGIEVFRKTEHEENNEINNMTENTTVETGAETENTTTENIIEENTIDENTTIEDSNTAQNPNNSVSNSTEKVEELKNVEELMQKAEKTLTARGWAGASNNVIGLKDGIIYYYNKSSEEFYKIAEGIEDIYYKGEYSEEITAKKNSKFKEIKNAPEFLVYE